MTGQNPARKVRRGGCRSTVRNLLMAWVLTLPASMILAGFLFWGFNNMF
jgi:PiT family inorganic phosphate transporter